MKIILKRIFGGLALLFGITIILWFIYNQFFPTPQFQRSYVGIFQLALPIIMIVVGWNWIFPKKQGKDLQYPYFVFAKILEPITTEQRVMKYSDPLNDSLTEEELGEVTGGGVELKEDNSIAWVGIDINLADLDRGVEFIRSRLVQLGAPRGSTLQFTKGTKNITLPIYTAG